MFKFKLNTHGHLLNRKKVEQLKGQAKNIIVNGKSIPICHLLKNAEQCDDFSRTLNLNGKCQSYYRRELEFKPALHWGQLKLMLSELEFLTIAIKELENKSDKKIIMVYAGAAPGHHILYLSKLFPNIYFELYDPNKFAIPNTDQIKTHVQYFTDEDAKYWSESKDIILFCSDIRSEPTDEKNIQNDMNMQLNWWKIINPFMSMFKFRLPWSEGKTIYLEGDIYIQPYPGPTSTETRLIVRKNAKLIEYDNIQYESLCFYHNVNIRTKKFGDCKYNIKDHLIDNCYDCTSFIHIVKQYIELTNSKYSKYSVLELIKEIQHEITFGKHDIYQLTKKNFQDNLNIIISKLIVKCKNPKCIFKCL